MADDYAWLDELKPAAPAAPPDKVAPGGLRGVITGERGPQTGGGEAAARGALQGASLGFGDEIAAVVDTGVSHIPGLRFLAEKFNASAGGAGGGLPLDNPDLTYQQRREAYRARNRQAAADHPVIYHGAEVAGAIAAPVPGAGAKGLVSAVKAGAKGGALAGLGGSEADLTAGDVAGAARDTAIGTGVGAGAGLVGDVAGRGVRKFVEGAKRRVLDRTSEEVLRGETAAKAKTANKALERFGEENERLGDLFAREPKLEKLLALKAESSPAAVAKRVGEKSGQWNTELDAMYEKMAKAGRVVKPAEIIAQFDRQMGEALKSGDQNVIQAMRRARAQFADEYGNFGPLDPETLRGLKKTAASAAFAAVPGAPSSAKAKVGQFVWRVFGDAIEKQAKGSGVDVARMRQLNSDLSVMIPIEQALAERGAAARAGRLSMTEALAGAGGVGTGLAHGLMAGHAGAGAAEAAILGLLAGGAAKYGPKAAKAIERRADYTLSKMSPKFLEYAARVSDGLKKGLTLQAAAEAAKQPTGAQDAGAP